MSDLNNLIKWYNIDVDFFDSEPMPPSNIRVIYIEPDSTACDIAQFVSLELASRFNCSICVKNTTSLLYPIEALSDVTLPDRTEIEIQCERK